MKRNAFFDNAKLVLIFLVVFGHLIQPSAQDSSTMHTIYIWIYTFHMPAFIFLSGFFAKGAGNKDYIYNLAKKLLLPYLIFQTLYTAFYFFIGKDSWQTGLFDPQWALWFLFSLFSWHLLLIGFKKLNPAIGLPVAFTIGLLAGYIPEVGSLFSLSRTFVFFPFFLAGYWMYAYQLNVLKKPIVRLVSLVVLSASAVYIYTSTNFDTGWLLASKSYAELGLPMGGIVARSFVYITAVVMSASIFAWIPSRHFKLTTLGARTLYVYLLHGFFIQTFRKKDLFTIDNAVDAGIIILLAAGLVLLLSSKPVLGIWQPFIEGRWTVLKDYVKSGIRKQSTSQ